MFTSTAGLPMLLATLLTLIVGAGAAAAPPPSVQPESNQTALPATVDALITANQLREAAQSLRDVDEKTSTLDWSRTLATLATRYQQSGDPGAAAEFYLRAVSATENPAATGVSIERKMALRSAAASVLLKPHAPRTLGTS